jgi:hypothetical protein
MKRSLAVQQKITLKSRFPIKRTHTVDPQEADDIWEGLCRFLIAELSLKNTIEKISLIIAASRLPSDEALGISE